MANVPDLPRPPGPATSLPALPRLPKADQPRVDVDQLLADTEIRLTCLAKLGDEPLRVPLFDIFCATSADIDEALYRMSSWLAWMGQRWAAVEAAREAADRRKIETFSSLAVEAREALEAAKEKVTEKAVEQAVRAHPDYARANEVLIQATYERDCLIALMRAIELRHEALRTIAANRRREFTASTPVTGR